MDTAKWHFPFKKHSTACLSSVDASRITSVVGLGLLKYLEHTIDTNTIYDSLLTYVDINNLILK